MAGDLFMDTGSEAALRRAAARWRRRRGLPPAPAGLAPGALSPEEAAHALHLARRGRLRRRMRLLGGAAAAAAALSLAAGLAWGGARPPAAASAGARVAHPAHLTTRASGLTFTVQEVTFAPSETRVRYRVDPQGDQNWRWHQVRLNSTGRVHLLEARELHELSDGEPTLLAIFAPIPDDADGIQIWFDALDPIPASYAWAQVEQDGPLVFADLSLAYGNAYVLSPLHWPSAVLVGAYFASPDMGRYPVRANLLGREESTHTEHWRVEATVPPEVSAEELELWLYGFHFTRRESALTVKKP